MKTTALSILFLALLLISCAPAITSVPPALTPLAVRATNTLQPEALSAGSTEEAGPYDENAVPSEDIAKALAASQQDGRLVLLDFGANWCPDCLVLSTLFEDPGVKPFLDENFRVVSIDVGYWDKNLNISQQYGSPIENGIPAVVVLAPNGEIVASTKDGALANARTATAQDILAFLKTWLAQKP